MERSDERNDKGDWVIAISTAVLNIITLIIMPSALFRTHHRSYIPSHISNVTPNCGGWTCSLVKSWNPSDLCQLRMLLPPPMIQKGRAGKTHAVCAISAVPFSCLMSADLPVASDWGLMSCLLPPCEAWNTRREWKRLRRGASLGPDIAVCNLAPL